MIKTLDGHYEIWSIKKMINHPWRYPNVRSATFIGHKQATEWRPISEGYVWPEPERTILARMIYPKEPAC